MLCESQRSDHGLKSRRRSQAGRDQHFDCHADWSLPSAFYRDLLPFRLGRRFDLRTYPSGGVACRLVELPALLLLLALPARCNASASSARRRLLALSEIAEELRRCWLRLLSLDTGRDVALSACPFSSGMDSTSNTVDSRSGVRSIDLSWLGDWLVPGCCGGLTAIVRSIRGGCGTGSAGASIASWLACGVDSFVPLRTTPPSKRTRICASSNSSSLRTSSESYTSLIARLASRRARSCCLAQSQRNIAHSRATKSLIA